ncbi:MAG: two-component system response regulator CreB [Verrucomicrobia bacterium]|nr:two-component system response regulator CreB [Verrucomicrobiota bacterium]
MKKRILVVEDEPSILANIVYSLETEGFEPQGCATGEQALASFAASPPDLVILDVGLPDLNGFDLCRTWRQQSDVPVIFLTARGQEVDRVVGLEIGADDYLVKPFSPRELSARVRAILRRCRAPMTPGRLTGHPSTPANTPFQLLEDRAQILYFGSTLPLSATEFRILRVLCQHPGRLYSRSQLMDQAWTEPETALERTVDAHIKSLRAKLRAVRPDLDPIETRRGLGYSLKEHG